MISLAVRAVPPVRLAKLTQVDQCAENRRLFESCARIYFGYRELAASSILKNQSEVSISSQRPLCCPEGVHCSQYLNSKRFLDITRFKSPVCVSVMDYLHAFLIEHLIQIKSISKSLYVVPYYWEYENVELPVRTNYLAK